MGSPENIIMWTVNVRSAGEADPDALVAPEIESVYSTEQTSVKVDME